MWYELYNFTYNIFTQAQGDIMDFNNNYKKISMVLLACSLVCLPACKKKHKKKDQYVSKTSTLAQNKVHLPLAYQTGLREDEAENLDGLFDNEVDTLVDNHSVNKELAQNKVNTEFDLTDPSVKNENILKTVYFDFDSHVVGEKQKEVAVYDAIQLKQLLEEAREQGDNILVTVAGHACHSAGDAEYNLIKSQNRADTVAAIFKELGVPAENIKVVGHGKEFPAVIDGKKVTGSRQEQWPNRRVEVHIIKT